jgi:hypothetical protein
VASDEAEDNEPVDLGTDNEKVSIPQEMAAYSQAISRTVRK